MSHRLPILVLIAAPLYASTLAEAADTLRNPPGTSAPPTTLRNPLTLDATPQPAGGDRSGSTLSTPETRPARGSDIDSAPDRASFGTSGPVAPVPGGVANGTVAGGGGPPSVLDPAGANAGTTPSPTSGSRPNGGTPESGSKAAPMQANGVRKVE